MALEMVGTDTSTKISKRQNLANMYLLVCRKLNATNSYKLSLLQRIPYKFS